MSGAAFARAVLGATGRGKLTVLIYHRVLPESDPLFPSTPDARRFDEQMRWLKETQDPLPLAEAVERLRAGQLPPRAACVTFDDGYADNAEVALPILKRHDVPATFFVASGFLDGGRMWNDTVIEALRRAPRGRVDLEAIGLGAFDLGDAASRRRAIDRIIPQLKYLPPEQRQAAVERLAACSAAALPVDMMMRADQVRELHRTGMTIGAHTVTHPILTRLTEAQARTEIAAGRDALRAIIGAPVRLFAYPNGRPGEDYAPAHVRMVRELGFDAAFSTRRAAAVAADDAHELPRFTPWAPTFARFALGLARNHLGRA